MIAETIIASVALLLIAIVWMALRFAERVLGVRRQIEPSSDERRQALEWTERCIAGGDQASLRALLIARPHHLPDDARARALAWLDPDGVAGSPPSRGTP
mgnify:CR=1 FL=1